MQPPTAATQAPQQPWQRTWQRGQAPAASKAGQLGNRRSGRPAHAGGGRHGSSALQHGLPSAQIRAVNCPHGSLHTTAVRPRGAAQRSAASRSSVPRRQLLLNVSPAGPGAAGHRSAAPPEVQQAQEQRASLPPMAVAACARAQARRRDRRQSRPPAVALEQPPGGYGGNLQLVQATERPPPWGSRGRPQRVDGGREPCAGTRAARPQLLRQICSSHSPCARTCLHLLPITQPACAGLHVCLPRGREGGVVPTRAPPVWRAIEPGAALPAHRLRLGTGCAGPLRAAWRKASGSPNSCSTLLGRPRQRRRCKARGRLPAGAPLPTFVTPPCMHLAAWGEACPAQPRCSAVVLPAFCTCAYHVLAARRTACLPCALMCADGATAAVLCPPPVDRRLGGGSAEAGRRPRASTCRHHVRGWRGVQHACMRRPSVPASAPIGASSPNRCRCPLPLAGPAASCSRQPR